MRDKQVGGRESIEYLQHLPVPYLPTTAIVVLKDEERLERLITKQLALRDQIGRLILDTVVTGETSTSITSPGLNISALKFSTSEPPGKNYHRPNLQSSKSVFVTP